MTVISKNVAASLKANFLVIKIDLDKRVGQTKAGNDKIAHVSFSTSLENIEGLPEGYSMNLVLVRKEPEEEAPAAKTKKKVAAAPTKTTNSKPAAKAAKTTKAAKTSNLKAATKKAVKVVEEAADEEEEDDAEPEVSSPVVRRGRGRPRSA